MEEIANAGYQILETLGGGWLLPVTEEGAGHIRGTSDRLGMALLDSVREVLKNEVIEEEPK